MPFNYRNVIEKARQNQEATNNAQKSSTNSGTNNTQSETATQQRSESHDSQDSGFFGNIGNEIDGMSDMSKGLVGGAMIGVPVALLGAHLYRKWRQKKDQQSDSVYQGY